MSEVILLDKMRSAPVGHNPYYQYYKNSIGRGSSGIGDVIRSFPNFQRGYGGVVNPAHFYQDRDQLGEGIGSFLMNLFRYTKPLLRRGLHQVVDVASKVASDAIEGRNVKDSLQQHTKDKANELIKKIPKAFSGVINNPSVNVAQASLGSGLKRRRREFPIISPPPEKKRLIDSGARKKRVKKKEKYPLLRIL